MLVALPQSPETRRPDRYPDAARAARDTVLDRVFARGVITGAERDDAKREVVPRQPPGVSDACRACERGSLPARAGAAQSIRLTFDAKLQASLEDFGA